MTWTSTTKFVDLETGEQITRSQAETHYIKVKTKKHVTINDEKTTGYVEYTTECQKDLKLFKN